MGVPATVSTARQARFVTLPLPMSFEFLQAPGLVRAATSLQLAVTVLGPRAYAFWLLLLPDLLLPLALLPLYLAHAVLAEADPRLLLLVPTVVWLPPVRQLPAVLAQAVHEKRGEGLLMDGPLMRPVLALVLLVLVPLLLLPYPVHVQTMGLLLALLPVLPVLLLLQQPALDLLAHAP